MNRLVVIGGLWLAAGCASVASAWAGPAGTWRVEDGTANVEVAPCGDALCGTVAWADKPDQKDTKNPDISKRNRPVLGMTVLQNMKPDGNKWVGSIYNARDGRTYTAKISMRGDNTLRVEGCIAGGMLCGGQDWARVAQPTAMAPSAAPAAQPAGVATVAPAAKPADAPAPTQRLEAPAVVQTPPSAVAPDQPSASPVSPTKRKTAKRSGYSADASQITSDDAESAGRSAADMINRMMVDNGVSGARIDPDQAAIAARSARKIINQLMKDNGFRY